MKNLSFSLIFIFVYFTSYSQFGLGVGYESSSNSEYNTAIKFNLEKLSINDNNYKGFIYGLDFGINFLENNKTGDIGLNDNPQDATGNFLYTIITPGFKVGLPLTTKKGKLHGLYLVGGLGLNIVQEHKEFNSSSTGLYSIETNYKKNSPYFRAGIRGVTGFLGWGVGYGTNGFYVNLTGYTDNDYIKESIKNSKELKKIKVDERGEWLVGDVRVSKLKNRENQLIKFVETFIKECEIVGIDIDVNVDNIDTSFHKAPGIKINIIPESENAGNLKFEKIDIKFNKKEWQKATVQTKLYLLFSQLGHDVLKLSSSDNVKMVSKFKKKKYTWEEFQTDTDSMFEIYINNLYK